MSYNTYAIAVVNQLPITPVDANVWGDVRYDPNASTPDYIGYNLTMGESVDTPTWKIYKYVYDSGSNLVEILLAYGAWSLRTTYFPSTPTTEDFLITEAGDFYITEGGDPLITESSEMASGILTDENGNVFTTESGDIITTE